MYQEADEMSSSAVVNVSAGVTRGSGTFTVGPGTLKVSILLYFFQSCVLVIEVEYRFFWGGGGFEM